MPSPSSFEAFCNALSCHMLIFAIAATHTYKMDRLVTWCFVDCRRCKYSCLSCTLFRAVHVRHSIHTGRACARRAAWAVQKEDHSDHGAGLPLHQDTAHCGGETTGLCVCVCVCVCACVHTFMHVWVWRNVCVWEHCEFERGRMCVCVWVYLCVCVCVCVREGVWERECFCVFEGGRMCVYERESVGLYVYEGGRVYVCVRERESVCVCVYERECVCVCVRERDCIWVCVSEGGCERENVCVCVCAHVCVWKRENVCVRESMYVCVRMREGVREGVGVWERRSMCLRGCVHMCGCWNTSVQGVSLWRFDRQQQKVDDKTCWWMFYNNRQLMFTCGLYCGRSSCLQWRWPLKTSWRRRESWPLRSTLNLSIPRFCRWCYRAALVPQSTR